MIVIKNHSSLYPHRFEKASLQDAVRLLEDGDNAALLIAVLPAMAGDAYSQSDYIGLELQWMLACTPPRPFIVGLPMKDKPGKKDIYYLLKILPRKDYEDMLRMLQLACTVLNEKVLVVVPPAEGGLRPPVRFIDPVGNEIGKTENRNPEFWMDKLDCLRLGASYRRPPLEVYQIRKAWLFSGIIWSNHHYIYEDMMALKYRTLLQPMVKLGFRLGCCTTDYFIFAYEGSIQDRELLQDQVRAVLAKECREYPDVKAEVDRMNGFRAIIYSNFII